MRADAAFWDESQSDSAFRDTGAAAARDSSVAGVLAGRVLRVGQLPMPNPLVVRGAVSARRTRFPTSLICDWGPPGRDLMDVSSSCLAVCSCLAAVDPQPGVKVERPQRSEDERR
jgi:hypothetical protein